MAKFRSTHNQPSKGKDDARHWNGVAIIYDKVICLYITSCMPISDRMFALQLQTTITKFRKFVFMHRRLIRMKKEWKSSTVKLNRHCLCLNLVNQSSLTSKKIPPANHPTCSLTCQYIPDSRCLSSLTIRYTEKETRHQRQTFILLS